MKKLLFILFLLLTSVGVWAQVFVVDNIAYNITSAEELTVSVLERQNVLFDLSVPEIRYSGPYNVVIPETVTYEGKIYRVVAIDDNAFSQPADSLFSIIIPKSVTSIKDNALSNCSSMTSITIPNSVTSIGDFAFCNCDMLASITIPNSVTRINGSAFSHCAALGRIVVDAANPVYDSRDNCNAIIKTASNTLIRGCKNTIIPNSVSKIGRGAYYCCDSLISVTIPNSIAFIDSLAFFGCRELKDVYCFAERVPTTGEYVFQDVNLSSATLHVPAASLKDYRRTAPWSNFGKIVAMKNSKGRAKKVLRK